MPPKEYLQGLVERLWVHGEPKKRIQNDHSFIKRDCREAADALQSLLMERERMREALEAEDAYRLAAAHESAFRRYCAENAMTFLASADAHPNDIAQPHPSDTAQNTGEQI